LHFPAVTIRNSHERPEGIESGSVVASSLNNKNIISSVNIAIKNYEPNEKTSVYDYNIDLVSKKIVKIISGYISVINQKVWYKY
jgi:UDP-N-acetylglucosamine 2-epimerase (non-hydrolysing)